MGKRPYRSAVTIWSEDGRVHLDLLWLDGSCFGLITRSWPLVKDEIWPGTHIQIGEWIIEFDPGLPTAIDPENHAVQIGDNCMYGTMQRFTSAVRAHACVKAIREAVGMVNGHDPEAAKGYPRRERLD